MLQDKAQSCEGEDGRKSSKRSFVVAFCRSDGEIRLHDSFEASPNLPIEPKEVTVAWRPLSPLENPKMDHEQEFFPTIEKTIARCYDEFTAVLEERSEKGVPAFRSDEMTDSRQTS